MQQSPCELKEKLLRALDQDYNVVDMSTVLEVISCLENAPVTQEALKESRIGKYINELRKKSDNVELVHRAKALVRSWRKLLPWNNSYRNLCNGEHAMNSVGTTVFGPGSAHTFGPGPGPGNISKNCDSIPGSPCPPLHECSTSPYCSSASNSPQCVLPRLQGSTSGQMLNCVPLNKSQSTLLQSSRTSSSDDHLNKSNIIPSQVFKPVSPAHVAAHTANSSGQPFASNVISQPIPQKIPYVCLTRLSDIHFYNCGITVSANDCAMPNATLKCGNVKQKTPLNPPIASGSAHSTLDLAKTNVANKRLRKKTWNSYSRTKKKKAMQNKSSNLHNVQNGIDPISAPDKFHQSESSAFESVKSTGGESSVANKQKRISDSVLTDLSKDKLNIINSLGKLQKVKTTQQLIEELQAKKEVLNLPSSILLDCVPETDNAPPVWKKSPSNSGPSAELLVSKSELMKKFLSSSPESPSEYNIDESLSVERLSPLSDAILSKSSVISSERDNNVPYTDPVTLEINHILSSLPPLDPNVNIDSDEILPETSHTENESSEQYLEQWEHVNGNYAADGSWKSWDKCLEKEIAPGETLVILPYVNIN